MKLTKKTLAQGVCFLIYKPTFLYRLVMTVPLLGQYVQRNALDAAHINLKNNIEKTVRRV